MGKDKPLKSSEGAQAKTRFNRGKQGTFPLDKDFVLKPEGVIEHLGGDELQTLTITHSDAEPARPFTEGFFWRELEGILANCDEIMRLHGWDRHEGNGRNFPGDRTAEPFSNLWYAGKIGFECWNLLHWHRIHGPNEMALFQTMRLGQLISEAEWRAAFKPAIVTGKAQRSTLDKHRKKSHENGQKRANARRRLVKQMMTETSRSGGALLKWLQHQLEIRHDIKVSARTLRGDKAALEANSKKVGRVG